MTDHGYSLPRPTRRQMTPGEIAEAELYDDGVLHGFTITAERIAARPTAHDTKYGLSPSIDRETYGRTPGYRLRGTTPDPLDEPGTKKRGRQADILFEGRTFPVESNVSPATSKALTAAMVDRHEASPGTLLYDGAKGRLTQHGRIKVMYRACKCCGVEFRQWVLVSQRRRWAWFCSEEHQLAAKRVADRERQRETRARARDAE